jgi:hypothetical protein
MILLIAPTGQRRPLPANLSRHKCEAKTYIYYKPKAKSQT